MRGILDLIDDGLVDVHLDALLVLFKDYIDVILALGIIAAESGQHGLLYLVVHVLSGDALFFFDILYGFKKFCVHFILSILICAKRKLYIYIETCNLTCAVCAFVKLSSFLPEATVTVPSSEYAFRMPTKLFAPSSGW